MKATIKVNPTLVLEVNGETQKDLFNELSLASEVFGESACGVCKGTNIRPVVRHVSVGKKDYDYHEWHCMNAQCRARLSMGQNMEGGTLFPIRKLTDDGKPDRENGKYGTHNGWTKYKGEPKQ